MRPAVLLALVAAAGCGTVQSPTTEPEVGPDARVAMDAAADAAADAPPEPAWTVDWEADGGFPDGDDCAPWVLHQAGDPAPARPSIVGDHLQMATTADGQFLIYQHRAEVLTPPAVVVLEARVRYATGNSTSSRSGASIGFWFGGKGETVAIASDRIFLASNATAAYRVATSDRFHDLRLETDLATEETAVSLDGAVVLRATGLMTEASVADVIGFGDGTGFAYATSEWQRVRHNAHRAAGCARGRALSGRP